MEGTAPSMVAPTIDRMGPMVLNNRRISNFWIRPSEGLTALSVGQGIHVAFRLAQGRITIKRYRAYILANPILAIWFPFFGVYRGAIFSGLRTSAMVKERLAGKHEARQIRPYDNQGDVTGR